MTAASCTRLPLGDLADYAAGELTTTEADAIEEHLFACPDCGGRAAELDALLRGVQHAMRAAEIGGFTTDEILNRLAREGVRVRSFTLSPGAVVPCAVWEGDELMALRLRAEIGAAAELTVTQRVGGAEVVRTTGEVVAASRGEVIFAQPAASVRDLPPTELEVVLAVRQDGEERAVATYTLVHGGTLHR
jgi:anti-sigma factor RsiW